MCTNLPADTVDVELTLRTVQGIYICHKDHTMETTIFTSWSKSVIPFPSSRKKDKTFKEDSKGQMTLTWTPSDSTPTKPPKIPRKYAPGKVRTWWSNCNHHFNPIKTNWVDKLGTNLINTGNISIIKPIPQKACEQFGATCSFCRQQVPHSLLNQSDWSSKDWDGKKAKAKEQNPFSKSNTFKTKAENSTLDLVGSLPFHGLKIQPDKMDKKAPEVSTTPTPPLEQGAVGTAPKVAQTKLDTVPKEEDKTVAQELREHIEEAKYKLYIRQLSTEESDIETEMDGSEYPFLD